MANYSKRVCVLACVRACECACVPVCLCVECAHVHGLVYHNNFKNQFTSFQACTNTLHTKYSDIGIESAPIHQNIELAKIVTIQQKQQ